MRKIESAAALGMLILAGCATVPQPQAPKTASVTIPTFTLTPASARASITKGGITATLIPGALAARKVERATDGPQFAPSFLDDVTWKLDSNHQGRSRMLFYRTTAPYYELPRNLTFTLNMKNNLPVPLRLGGAGDVGPAVLAFRVGGKQIPVSAYLNAVVEFQGAIILPGAELDLVLAAPSLDLLGESSRVVVGLYDVITGVDSASKPKNRGQFEWDFDYSKTEEIVEVPVQSELMERVQ